MVKHQQALKKLLVIFIIGSMFSLLGESCVLAKSSSTSYKKYNIYNSKGQKDGYYKVYSSGDKTQKVEKFNSQSKKIERLQYSK